MAIEKKSGYRIAKDYQDTNALLLKCIARHIISNLKSYGITQKDLADAIGVGQSTISSWGSDDEKKVPTLYQLLRICNVIHIPLNALFCSILNMEAEEEKSRAVVSTLENYVRQFGPIDPLKQDKSYDSSQNHLLRLERFQSKEYIAVYLHRSSSSKMKINRLHISTEVVDKRGFCPFTMRINSKSAKYTGKIVSPPGTYYTYFYLTGGDTTERGMWVLYYPPTIDDDYRCGSGVLLSIDRSTSSPSFQWIILIEKDAYKKEQENNLFEFLNRKFPSNDYPVWVFSQDSLRAKHEEVYSMLFPADKE